MNEDIEAHPVGHSTPQILVCFVCLSDLNFVHCFQKLGENTKEKRNETQKLQAILLPWFEIFVE